MRESTPIIDILLRSINILPSILMLALLVYFYTKKRIPGLLWLLIGYTGVTLVVIASTFGVMYLSGRSALATEIQRFYSIIGVVSIVSQVITIVGMGILLHSYSSSKDKEKIADSF